MLLWLRKGCWTVADGVPGGRQLGVRSSARNRAEPCRHAGQDARGGGRVLGGRGVRLPAAARGKCTADLRVVEVTISRDVMRQAGLRLRKILPLIINICDVVLRYVSGLG